MSRLPQLRSLARSLERLSLQTHQRHLAGAWLDPPRYLSSSSKNGKDPKKDAANTTDDDNMDLFGVHFDDGADKTGPTLPPLLERDAATGRLTGQVAAELSPSEKDWLRQQQQQDPVAQEQHLLKKLDQEWQDTDPDTGLPQALLDFGARVRRNKAQLTPVGRSPKETQATNGDPQLSSAEFEQFSAYMKKRHGLDVHPDQLPVQRSPETPSSSAAPKKKKSKQGEEEESDLMIDETDLALQWLTTRAQRQMDDSLDDRPYADLMPHDLSPSRLVNRRRAQKLPVRLLHHNHIPLLQSFLTPTGQIQNRVQTRLGARDQRKIAKLVKRARALGLMPHTTGQFKVERHGWKYAADMQEDRPWEETLAQRGLTIRRSSAGGTANPEAAATTTEPRSD